MILHLTRGNSPLRVPLRLPASPAEEGEAFARLDEISTDVSSTRIMEVTSPIPTLAGYIKSADINGPDYEKLNQLAERLNSLTEREQWIFSGALDAESINGLDDVLHVAEHLGDYVILPNINSDTELGRFLVDTGYKNFPEAVRPYLDYRAIGAEYYAENGGAFGSGGYVRRKSSVEQRTESRPALITIHLRTMEAAEAMQKRCCLSLPATDEELERTKSEMDIDCFADAFITKIEFGTPYLEALIPQDGFCVEDANELALAVEEMQRTDGELLKFCSALEAEQPQTLQAALGLAMNIDDYERITEGAYEYGQTVLRRIGADDELIDTIDGYMDFERFGEDMMAEDGVRQTEFGLVRRLSEPFPSSELGQSFQ